MNPEIANQQAAPPEALPGLPCSGFAGEEPRAALPAPGSRSARSRSSAAPRLPGSALLAQLRGDPARVRAIRESWRALWRSRALVWLAGVGTILAFGFGPVRKAFNPPGLTRGFGWLGNLLAAPAARWDAAWYLVIARDGYHPAGACCTLPRTAFFPLYPLGLRTIAATGLPPVLAGVLLSVGAFALALYGIHRLTTLELARAVSPARGTREAGEVARLAVAVMAFAPMAFFFSAVYSESLYLALSVGVFWSARHGRWAWVGLLGALASATRSTGLLLMLPALIIYMYGPREDRPPDRGPGAGLSRARPRYRLRREALWLVLVPAGTVAYGIYLGLASGDPLAPFHAEGTWGRHFAGPFLGAWDGLRAAFDGARQLLSMQSRHVYFAADEGSPSINAAHNLLDGAFLLAAVPATVGVLRRLPFAYGAYVVAAVALSLSEPVTSQPLMSLPRFLVVLFPFAIWAGAWLCERPRLQRPLLLASAASMALFVAQFSTWHWVA